MQLLDVDKDPMWKAAAEANNRGGVFRALCVGGTVRDRRIRLFSTLLRSAVWAGGEEDS